MPAQPMKVEYPVANTFIQFTASEFLQPRSAFSCPASRMASLEEDPRESVDCITFQWPATRGPSLDDEVEAAKFAHEMNAALQNVCSQLPASTVHEVPQVSQAHPPRWASIEDDEDLPEFMKKFAEEDVEPAQEPVPATRGPSLDEDLPKFQWPATRGPSLDEFAGAYYNFQSFATPAVLNLESLAAPAVAPANSSTVPEMPHVLNLASLALPSVAPAEANAQWTAMDEFMKVNSSSSHKESFASDASTASPADEDQALTTPPSGLSDDEDDNGKDTSATLKISLTDTLGLWSIGSADHELGTCKPCAFLWKDVKQPGCQNGQDCVFCHLCPPGEVKRRKKTKMFMRKVAKNLQYAEEFGMGFQPQFDQNQIAAGYGMW